MRDFLQRRLVAPLLALLRQDVTPRKLALSLALGIVIGLVPVLGVPTARCALAALASPLNRPALQLVNYLLTQLQQLLAPLAAFALFRILEPVFRHPTPAQATSR
ncbi:MAG TPA: hypothetical protein VK624_07590 [Steroidobacteraceae bacterium]|nr:hypothetical protein [Steroidobacteraceae bacterium]